MKSRSKRIRGIIGRYFKRFTLTVLFIPPLLAGLVMAFLYCEERCLLGTYFELGMPNGYYLLVERTYDVQLLIVPHPGFGTQPTITARVDNGPIRPPVEENLKLRRIVFDKSLFCYQTTTNAWRNNVSSRRRWWPDGQTPIRSARIVTLKRKGLTTLCKWIAMAYGACIAGLCIKSARRRFRALRSIRLAAAGRCVICGYDLRASSHRCPECGAGSKTATKVAKSLGLTL